MQRARVRTILVQLVAIYFQRGSYLLARFVLCACNLIFSSCLLLHSVCASARPFIFIRHTHTKPELKTNRHRHSQCTTNKHINLSNSCRQQICSSLSSIFLPNEWNAGIHIVPGKNCTAFYEIAVCSAENVRWLMLIAVIYVETYDSA